MFRNREISSGKIESQKELVQKFLKRNISFNWKYSPKKWSGLTEADLKKLSLQIAIDLKITPEQAKKINLVFGDCFEVPTPNGLHSNRGMCLAIYDEDDKIINCTVMIDRYLASMQLGNPIMDNFSYLEENIIELHSQFELIVWLIAEELHHSRLFIMAGDKEKYDRWKNNYKDTVTKRNKVLQSEYDESIVEMVAARETLRVLSNILLGIDPKRAEFFNNKYKTIKKTDEHIMLSLELLPKVDIKSWKTRPLLFFRMLRNMLNGKPY